MKIALVHDYIKEYGGAEKVLEVLHELYPDAPIYTSVYLPSFLGPHKKRFKDWKIKTSFLQYLPFKAKLISVFRVISPLIFKGFDFSKYDVVIVSATGAYFPNSINKKKAIQVCYCHTPPRYLYGYMTARQWKKNKLIRIIGETINHFLRIEDYNFSKNVDYYIANSDEVKARIKKFYKREAMVINPPVNSVSSRLASSVQLKDKKLNANDLDAKHYYLTGGRLARAKGIDIIVEAFNKIEKPLKIFGRGFAGFESELKKIGAENIKFVGEVTDEEKFELMKKAKAFIFASYDEDFGITPVEAMSVGTPVIAFNSGGVKETVINGKTGIFYDKNNPEELIKAIEKFKKLSINPKDCVNQAQKFSKERFIKEINQFVKNTFNKN